MTEEPLEGLKEYVNERFLLLEKNLKSYLTEALAPIREYINDVLLKMENCSEKLARDHENIESQLDKLKKLVTVLLLLNVAELSLLFALLFR